MADRVAERIVEIDGELRQLEARQDALEDEKQQLQELQANIAVGDLVKSTKGFGVGGGQVFKVSQIGFGHFGGKPWLKGFQQLKDGTFGKIRKHLFDNWEKV